MEPLLKIRDLKKIYKIGDLQVQALRGVNLDFQPGEFIVLLGASGSGKSTLLNIIGGLDSCSTGKVLYKEQLVTELSVKDLTEYRRRNVGFVFQFYNLISNLTAEENIRLVTDISDQSLEIDYCLDLVGLRERKNHFPVQLSGGEQQRVSIARAIAKKPEILLCDEPTGALDLATGKIVLEAILKVHKELKTLAIVITHNSAIAGLADRVLYLSDGQIRKEERNETKIKVDEVFW
jgi:putative ABC transport system ATP-binding protein